MCEKPWRGDSRDYHGDNCDKMNMTRATSPKLALGDDFINNIIKKNDNRFHSDFKSALIFKIFYYENSRTYYCHQYQ